MSFETQKPDFIAELKFKTTEEGGHHTSANSGYRPTLKFAFSKNITSGQQTYIGQNSVKPGETVRAEIIILSPVFFENKLEKGMQFEVRDGSQIVAIGKLIEILNIDLLKSNH